MSSSVSVLFVCLGNICRSPTAEGVFRNLVKQKGLNDVILIDSAGTSGYHIGEPPDRRSQAAALKRGIDISRQKSRKLCRSDFDNFNYIVAMDKDNLRHLLEYADSTSRIQLLLSYATDIDDQNVPDPYYSGSEGFELVLDLVEQGCLGLLETIQKDLNLPID